MHAAEKIITDHLLQLMPAGEARHIHFKKLSEQYPYFGAARYLHVKELKNEAEENEGKELKKTVLFFNNAFWLQYLLRHNNYISSANAESIDTKATEVLPKEIPGYETDTDLPVIEEENGNEKIAILLKEQAASFAKPLTEKVTLAFEHIPRHTIDYFESLGIKLDVVQQGDQLGNKVKKFTDWLKQMKNTDASPTDLGTDRETEKLIEVLAENSNATKEVITEAMAEVLIKQGKKAKAIELYGKLSFLNPAKSTYFAAKIQQLKS